MLSCLLFHIKFSLTVQVILSDIFFNQDTVAILWFVNNIFNITHQVLCAIKLHNTIHMHTSTKLSYIFNLKNTYIKSLPWSIARI